MSQSQQKVQELTGYRIKVNGLVQGIGFRPFIYRFANSLSLNGHVSNHSDGVSIEIFGHQENCQEFIHQFHSKAPKAACIAGFEQEKIPYQDSKGFRILPSQHIEGKITEISPDIAVCKACLEDFKRQDHRIDYPFINCTNCGPRFSIIKDFPYDRKHTTMAKFKMCSACQEEYVDINDRRFHAQPVACNNCGPTYSFVGKQQEQKDFLQKLAECLNKGGIAAIKGMGGYNLACNAYDPDAVNMLRDIKKRDGKPFAVMFKSMDSIASHATVGTEEAELLQSWRAPIVLLEAKEEHKLPKSVSNGLGTIGCFLPYLPMHHLLFEKLETDAIVLTSGNLSDTPIIIEDNEAIENLADTCDGILINDREIFNRVDDSVARLIGSSTQLIRRSRGYAPAPIHLPLKTDGILAVGPELSNCFCIGKDNNAILSQHIGDLKNLETLDFYESNLEQFKKLFRFEPTLVACDMHPDYLSTQFAEKLELPIERIQHHHAHVASVMTQNNLDEKVIGISFDGTGWGLDSKTWGSEVMIADLLDFERLFHFSYLQIPGGDKNIKKVWRIGLSALYSAYGSDIFELDIPFMNCLKESETTLVIQSLDKNLNAPLSCSAGRLFDAVAAILCICHEASFHAEAPMRLEDAINPNLNINDHYTFTIKETIDSSEIIRQIVDDIKTGVSNEVIAAKFHNTIAQVAFQASVQIMERYQLSKVVLSGGTFQNKYLTEKLLDLFNQTPIQLYLPTSAPGNDGGLAIGQIAVTAKRRSLCV